MPYQISKITKQQLNLFSSTSAFSEALLRHQQKPKMSITFTQTAFAIYSKCFLAKRLHCGPKSPIFTYNYLLYFPLLLHCTAVMCALRTLGNIWIQVNSNIKVWSPLASFDSWYLSICSLFSFQCTCARTSD